MSIDEYRNAITKMLQEIHNIKFLRQLYVIINLHLKQN